MIAVATDSQGGRLISRPGEDHIRSDRDTGNRSFGPCKTEIWKVDWGVSRVAVDIRKKVPGVLPTLDTVFDV